MSWLQPSSKERTLMGVITAEIVGAMAVVSQMSLLSPPGFDDWVRRELAGDPATRAAHRPVVPR